MRRVWSATGAASVSALPSFSGLWPPPRRHRWGLAGVCLFPVRLLRVCVHRGGACGCFVYPSRAVVGVRWLSRYPRRGSGLTVPERLARAGR